MKDMDADFVEEVLRRIGQIAEDATPRWGTMTKQSMIAHLVWVVRVSLGRTSKPVPFIGNWLTVHVLRPISLSGILPMPKNIKFPKALLDQGITGREPGGTDTLQALLEEYLALVQADAFTPPPHPLLGALSIDGWARLHVLHFEHHLKQFGV